MSFAGTNLTAGVLKNEHPSLILPSRGDRARRRRRGKTGVRAGRHYKNKTNFSRKKNTQNITAKAGSVPGSNR